MEVPETDVAGCASADTRLRSIIAGLSDTDITRPSRLPGWSVGHVLTHLARNAESSCRRIDAAVRGDIVEQYPGGAAGREADIEAGATRSARDVEEDVTAWSSRLDELFASVPAAVWDRPVRTVDGNEHPVSRLPYARWREVEVHLVDLGIGPTPLDWPQDFVDRALGPALARLPALADERDLIAWVLGRGPAPRLDAWG